MSPRGLPHHFERPEPAHPLPRHLSRPRRSASGSGPVQPLRHVTSDSESATSTASSRRTGSGLSGCGSNRATSSASSIVGRSWAKYSVDANRPPSANPSGEQAGAAPIGAVIVQVEQFFVQQL